MLLRLSQLFVITVLFQGPACEAYSEHGFRGREKEVMNAITAIIKSGKASRLEIN